ncbi:MAG: hypothetical protein D8M52_11085 [Chlorobi bacterium]|nr:hypothetical protein [Chlorobiota bacterium]
MPPIKIDGVTWQMAEVKNTNKILRIANLQNVLGSILQTLIYTHTHTQAKVIHTLLCRCVYRLPNAYNATVSTVWLVKGAYECVDPYLGIDMVTEILQAAPRL